MDDGLCVAEDRLRIAWRMLACCSGMCRGMEWSSLARTAGTASGSSGLISNLTVRLSHVLGDHLPLPINRIEQRRTKVIAVHAADEADAYSLGALRLAFPIVPAGAEALLLHLPHHVAHALVALRLSLGKQTQVRDFGGGVEHRRCVRACGHAGATPDAGRRVESQLDRVGLDRHGVGIRLRTGMHADG